MPAPQDAGPEGRSVESPPPAPPARAKPASGAASPAPLSAQERDTVRRLAGTALDGEDQPAEVRANLPEWLYGRFSTVLGEETERETAAWCIVRGIDYQVDECPMAHGNKHLAYKEALNSIERESPGAKSASRSARAAPGRLVRLQGL